MMLPTLLTSILLSAAGVSAWADPLPCSGSCTNTHDPALIQRSSDGTYFLFSTGSNISIQTGSSAQGPWTYQGEVLPAGSSIDLDGRYDLWAPDVHEIDNTYYLYYAVSSFGSQNSAIGVATSSSMDSGSWTDHGSTGIESSTGDNYNAIDPNLIEVGDSFYMNFGSFWADIFQNQMSSPLQKLSSSTNTGLAFNATTDHSEEGSFMYYTGGYYYLFFSSGQCCNYDVSKPAPGDEYKVMVCRSSSPTGGFVDSNGVECTESGGTLVLGSHDYVYGPGGQGIYDDPILGTIIYYHYIDTNIGYEDSQALYGVNQIDFSSGWPVV